MAIVKPIILEGGQLKTAGVGDQVPQAYVQGLDTSLESKAGKVHTHPVSQVTGLGTAATKDVGTSTGNVMQVGAFGLGGANPVNNTYDVNDLPAGQRISLTDGITEADAAVQNLPALGGSGTAPRSWHVECTGIGTNRLVQTATEVFGAGTFKGRTFTRVKHDTWYPWQEVYKSNHIVGSTGTSTTNLMSQKAVTDQLATKANTSTLVTAGTGLTGGGDLSANRTLNVSYGTAAGTAAQGNDSRLSDSREWTGATIPQAEVEAGSATTRRAFTAQRLRQGIVAWFNGISGALGRTILTRTTAAQVRSDIGLGTAATANLTTSSTDTTSGQVLKVGDFGVGGTNPTDNSFDADNLLPGQRRSWTGTGASETECVQLNLPALGGSGTAARSWHVECVGSHANRAMQTATEVFGAGTTRGRTFTRVKHDAIWYPWKEVMRVGDYGWGSTTDTPISMNANLSVISGVYQGGGADAINFAAFGNFGTLTVTRRGAQIEQYNQIGSLGAAIRNSMDEGVTWSSWHTVYNSFNQLELGITPESARDALELTGEWVDLRPYLKPPYYWKTSRATTNPYPRIRKLSCGRVELDGVVSIAENTALIPIGGAFVNVPAPFRPALTSAGVIFVDTAEPLFFGYCNWIVSGEVQYGGNGVHGDVNLIGLGLPAPFTDGAISINGIYWFT